MVLLLAVLLGVDLLHVPNTSTNPELHWQIPLFHAELGLLKHRSQKEEFTAKP